MEEFAENKNPDRNRNENLILRGNAFYEIDLECMKRKKQKSVSTADSENPPQKRQRT